jgi:hypothetical protein
MGKSRRSAPGRRTVAPGWSHDRCVRGDFGTLRWANAHWRHPRWGCEACAAGQGPRVLRGVGTLIPTSTR